MRAAGLIALLLGPLAVAQDGAFEKDVRPFLAKHCVACHNAKQRTANLNLTDAAAAQPAVWDAVLEKLAAKKMPPPGLPSPAAEETAAVTTWIERTLKQSGFTRAADPGRVTMRRLNRAEYDNTVRDLLGVHARPSADFPADDSGYGFDNIGDVLSVSPMLMEKYIAAAKRLSRLAVHGEPLPAAPANLAHYLAKRSHDTRGTLAAPNILPFSLRGALYGSHIFPWDAEYEFRFRLVNFRYILRDPKQGGPRTVQLTPEEAKKIFPPMEAVLTIDGKPVHRTLVEGNLAVDYERGDIVARTRVTAGEHQLRVSFPAHADMDDPVKNVNPDLRRRLWTDYLDIRGPYNPSADPPESYRRLFICGHAKGGHKADCGRRIVTSLARRAYRRPPDSSEIDKLLSVAALATKQGEPFEESIRLAVQAVLVSPHFLFRVEKDPSGPGARELSDHELASRLSYFLWSSMPDDELLRAADEGALRKAAAMEAQVRRMLADPKSGALVDNFAAQWLQLRGLSRVRPDTARFPRVDEELLDAMRTETSLFVEAVIREDRSILDFLDAPFTYLNGPLARHYGIAGVSGEQFQRVSLDAGRRKGVITHGSVLTISSYPTRTSPVLRGKWVLENILGAPPPPPPPDVPEIDESKTGESASLREQLEQHRAKPACAVCHVQMDPIGFGLENFDATGAWRTHDGKFPVDSSGTLPGGQTFNGPDQLVGILKAQSDGFTRNLTERLMTYALGRGLERYDSSEVTRIAGRLPEQNHRFSALVMEIVNSPPFRMRRAEGENK